MGRGLRRFRPLYITLLRLKKVVALPVGAGDFKGVRAILQKNSLVISKSLDIADVFC